MVADGPSIAWVGAGSGPCAGLLERIRATRSIHGRPVRVEIFNASDWGAAAQGQHARVILASLTRLDYPWQAIAEYERANLGIPWGVVTGLWQAGSRRTGIGAVSHWQMPWYRWWDGWRSWIFPELARPGSLCSAQFEAITLPIDLASPSLVQAKHAGRGHLVIVAGCRETAATWQEVAQAAGWQTSQVNPREWTEDAAAGGGQRGPAAILWDDSCQDRLPTAALPGGPGRASQAHSQSQLMPQSVDQCRRLARSYPGVPIVAALAVGHVAAWPDLQAAGASDFFVKPSHALPLAEILWSLGRLRGAYQGARTG